MKNKLFILLITVSLAILTIACTKKQVNSDTLENILKRDRIIVGVKYDTKPFGYIDEKQNLKGFDIDLARYIAQNILGDPNKVEFKQVTPSTRILSLNSGQVDMVIATMTMTKKRKEIIDFSTPYYTAGQAVLVTKNSDIKSMSDLNGKRVIIIFGSTAEQNLRLIAPNSKVIGFKTYTNAYSALKQGRADAITSDDIILSNYANLDNSLKLLPFRYTKEPYAIGFRKGEESVSLINRVNSIISDMQINGELNKLKAKWIKF